MKNSISHKDLMRYKNDDLCHLAFYYDSIDPKSRAFASFVRKYQLKFYNVSVYSIRWRELLEAYPNSNPNLLYIIMLLKKNEDYTFIYLPNEQQLFDFYTQAYDYNKALEFEILKKMQIKTKENLLSVTPFINLADRFKNFYQPLSFKFNLQNSKPHQETQNIVPFDQRKSVIMQPKLNYVGSIQSDSVALDLTKKHSPMKETQKFSVIPQFNQNSSHLRSNYTSNLNINIQCGNSVKINPACRKKLFESDSKGSQSDLEDCDSTIKNKRQRRQTE